MEKAQPVKPVKKYYDVKVEVMMPATLTYRVLADSPQQAAELIKNLSPNMIKPKLHGRREIKLMVYDAGCVTMQFVKNLLR